MRVGRSTSAGSGKPYFIKLMGFAVKKENITLFTLPLTVFTWSQMRDARDVKVVILGQDPYHGPDQAHGPRLCSEARAAPPQLGKHLQRAVYRHRWLCSLWSWRDWILMGQTRCLRLNAVLTARAHQANSRKERLGSSSPDAVLWLN